MTSWLGEPHFAEYLSVRETEADVQRKIELCRKALSLGLSPESEVKACGYLGIDYLSMGEEQQGVASLENALKLDASRECAVFSDPSNRKIFFPPLEVAHLRQVQQRRDQQGKHSVAPFVLGKLRLFDHLPGEHMTALLVELGAAYQDQGQQKAARDAFQRALKAEALQDIDEVALQIAKRNLESLNRMRRFQFAGNFIIAVTGVVPAVFVIVWMMIWLVKLFPYLAISGLLLYFGRHSYRLVTTLGWAEGVIQVAVGSAVIGVLTMVSMVFLFKSRDMTMVILLGLMVVALVSSVTLEYWVYRRHDPSVSSVRPFTELKEEALSHWHRASNLIVRLGSRLYKTLFSRSAS